jgi:hypothetical protein
MKEIYSFPDVALCSARRKPLRGALDKMNLREN